MAAFDDIRTVFIDLDDTIWDFTANSKVAMREVYAKYGLGVQCPYERFIESYLKHNADLWTLYHHGQISKEYLISERFRVAFEECGIRIDDPSMPMNFNNDYLETIVLCDHVVDGALHLLEHLRRRGPVYVLSNGFENLQYRKLRSGKLDKYIDNAVLSGINTVTIIHGKGTGVLRKAVQAHLRGHKNIKTFRTGTFGEGETGVTIAEINE